MVKTQISATMDVATTVMRIKAFAYTFEPKIWDYFSLFLKTTGDKHTQFIWESSSYVFNSNFGRSM